MKVEIIEKSENPLFQRVEIKFKVDHAGEPTPKRLDVRAQVAAQLGVSQELVVIDKLAGAYGKQEASGIARAYSSKERLSALEPKYLLVRGLPKEEKPKEEPNAEKPKKPDEKPKEEKPEKAEEKKPEKPKEEVKQEKKAQEEKVKEVGKGG